ncbi:MAG: hypothetical protein ACOYNN_06260 [Terrimicrobiaceae bacterium]
MTSRAPNKVGKVRPLQEAVLVSFIIFLVSLCGIAYLTIHARNSQSSAIRVDLGRTARSAAGLVDGDAHEALVKAAQTGTPEYFDALEPLVRFHRGVPEIAYLYTLVVKEDKLHFVLDTANAKDRFGFDREMKPSAVLDHYESQSPEEDQAEIAALLAGRDYVSQKPFRDEFGAFLTAVSPVRNSAGQSVALVGVDLNVEDYLARIRQAEVAAFVASALPRCSSDFLFLAFGNGWSFSKSSTTPPSPEMWL